MPAFSQDASAFADVPTSSWTYNAAAELQRHNVVTGWPADYFAGKRTLTRYEFAIALKRALDKLTYSSATIGDDNGNASLTELRITPELLTHVRELVTFFKTDLIALHADILQVNEQLSRLERRVTHQEPTGSGMPDLLRPKSLAPLSTPGAGSDLLRGNARSPLAPLARSIASPLFRNPFGQAEQDNLVNGSGTNILAPFGRNFVGQVAAPLTTQSADVNLAFALTRRSILGVSLHDAVVTNDLLAPGPYRTQDYGTSVSVRPVGNFILGAAANRNITERIGTDGSAAIQDSNTYLLNVGYKSGSASAVIGYKLMDPTGGNAASWTGNLLGLSPITAVQGPFTRIAFRFSDRLQSYVGGDYYGNTGFRASDPGSTANTAASSVPTLLTGNIYRGTAGIRWTPSRRVSLTADYEGVLYDISGAGSAAGRRYQPIEQYITLSAGLNLSRNAILKLAYQIYNQQDGSGSGDSPFSQNSGNTSVFTTQLAVHF